MTTTSETETPQTETPETEMSPEERFELRLLSSGLSQAGVAELFGVKVRTVRRWASGATPVPVAVTVVLGLLSGKRVTLDEVEYYADRISIEELDARKDLREAQRRLAEIQRAERFDKIFHQ
jgi:transcriptional regulator with XRE-family HTH domain